MITDTRANLEYIIQKMNDLGLETAHIHDLQNELVAIREPWLKRVTSTLSKHWRFVQGEVSETGDLAALLNKGLRTKLNKEEKRKVQDQLIDFLKVFPAGAFATANAVLPIPGTSLLTPILLQKAGLLPSQWQEAHLLNLLQKEEYALRSQGHRAIAKQFEELQNTLKIQAQDREKHVSLLLHWDENQNGEWDDEERTAYQRELEQIKEWATIHQHTLKWYVLQSGLVFGPTTFARLPKNDSEMLIRFDTKSKWVALSDLNDVEHLRGHTSDPLPQSTTEDDD